MMTRSEPVCVSDALLGQTLVDISAADQSRARGVFFDPIGQAAKRFGIDQPTVGEFAHSDSLLVENNALAGDRSPARGGIFGIGVGAFQLGSWSTIAHSGIYPLETIVVIGVALSVGDRRRGW